MLENNMLRRIHKEVAGHEVNMEEVRNAYKICIRKPTWNM
jgi:hypothetical protein